MGCSVHKIQYHPTMQVYAVLVSTPEPFLIRDENGMPIDGEDRGRFYRVCLFVIIKSKWSAELYLSQSESRESTMYYIDFRVYYNYFIYFKDPNALLPEVERFSMVLVSPVTWEIVDRYAIILF